MIGTALVATVVSLVACGSESEPETVVRTGAGCSPKLFEPTDSRFAPYAETVWPTEHADAWRTHAVAAGLPRAVKGMKLEASSVSLPPAPVWGYVGEGDDVYVIGGAPYLLDMFTRMIQGASSKRVGPMVIESLRYSRSVTPYLAKIDVDTMRSEVVLLREGESVNYTGGVLVHGNGSIYAVSRSVLYRLDPDSLEIRDSKELPLAPGKSGKPNKMTAYNGMALTRNGDLILKGWASTGGGDKPPGVILRVDPEDLATKAKLVTNQVGPARMAVVEREGREFLYLPNQTESTRFVIEDDGFRLDQGWTRTYLHPGTGATAGSSDVFMGDGVVFASNTEPQATSPMDVFSQRVDGEAPLAATRAFSGDEAGWNFFMMAGDPYESGIAVVGDEQTGRVSGFRVCDGGGQVEKLWQSSEIKGSAGMAINHEAGHVYTDDRTCVSRRCRLYLVVLDLRTGEELARTRVAGTKPSIGQIFIGPDAVYHVATDTREGRGHVTRVTALPSTA